MDKDIFIMKFSKRATFPISRCTLLYFGGPFLDDIPYPTNQYSEYVPVPLNFMDPVPNPDPTDPDLTVFFIGFEDAKKFFS